MTDTHTPQQRHQGLPTPRLKTGGRAFLCALLLTAVLCACSGTGNEYSDYPCRFTFDSQQHAYCAPLQSTVSSTGIFCKVSKTIKNGATYYRFETNEGLTDDIVLTAPDQRMSLILGTNNAIWFGYGNLDNPPVFYAYDGECPNCFDPNAIPVKSRPLTVATTGLARCAVCQREYNMNTGGNIVKGDKGDPLRRFRHASYSASGVLVVNN